MSSEQARILYGPGTINSAELTMHGRLVVTGDAKATPECLLDDAPPRSPERDAAALVDLDALGINPKETP